MRYLIGRLAQQCLRGSLLARTNPTLTYVPRQSITLTSAVNKRHYGPQEEHEKELEDKHWLKERYIAVALLPIIPAALAFPHPIMDTMLCSAMVLHSYWRLSGVAEDYIHGEVLPKIAQPSVKILTILAFGSLCYFNYFDVGFANAVQTIYSTL